MKLLYTILLICLTTVSYAKPLTLDEVLEGTCRVEANGALGSGTIIHRANNKYYVLTNAHVVGNSTRVNISLFNNGIKSNPIPANVVWRRRGQSIDFAIITIDISKLNKYKPRIIPLVPPNYIVQPKQYISSAGCPRGTWAVAWEGRALSNESGRILFHPPPVGGQSGSGIHVLWKNPKNGEYYTRVAAVLTWRIGREGTNARGYEIANGGAIPVSTLYNILQGKSFKTYKTPSNYIPVSYTGKYALGNNGKYYKEIYRENGIDYFVRIPSGIKIIQWGIICPPGGCPPNGSGPIRLGPINPGPINPFEELPDFSQPSDDSNITELEKEIRKLKKERDDLVSQLGNTRTDMAELRSQINEILKDKDADITKIDGLKKDIENYRNNLLQYAQELENKKKELSDTLNERNKAFANIQFLREDILVAQNETKIAEDKAKEEEDSKITQRTTAGIGGIILSILSAVATWWWNKKRKKDGVVFVGSPEINKDIKDKDIANYQWLHERISDLYERLGQLEPSDKTNPEPESGIEEKYNPELPTEPETNTLDKMFEKLESKNNKLFTSLTNVIDKRLEKIEKTSVSIVNKIETARREDTHTDFLKKVAGQKQHTFVPPREDIKKLLDG